MDKKSTEKQEKIFSLLTHVANAVKGGALIFATFFLILVIVSPNMGAWTNVSDKIVKEQAEKIVSGGLICLFFSFLSAIAAWILTKTVQDESEYTKRFSDKNTHVRLFVTGGLLLLTAICHLIVRLAAFHSNYLYISVAFHAVGAGVFFALGGLYGYLRKHYVENPKGDYLRTRKNDR